VNLFYMEEKEIKISKLEKNDTLIFHQLILLFNEVFETGKNAVPAEPYLQSLLERSGFIVLVIKCGNEIAGGLTAFELPMYDAERSEIFIYDVAVKAQFQRKGFGRQLLAELKKHCKENGIQEFFVPAHEEDKHALDFYRSAGGKAEKVIQFNFEAD
jgi:aminoglycoside 3-N-acetyltransferase I